MRQLIGERFVRALGAIREEEWVGSPTMLCMAPVAPPTPLPSRKH